MFRSFGGYRCALAFASVAGFASAAFAEIPGLFSVANVSPQLIEVNTAGDGSDFVAFLNGVEVAGLTFDPSQGLFFGASMDPVFPGPGEDPATLFSIDPVTGDTTAVAGLPDEPLALALDPASGDFFAVVDSSSPDLVRIDGDTFAVSTVGSTGLIAGLTFGPGGELLGVDSASDQLVVVDTATGGTTGIGSPGDIDAALTLGLAYDPLSDTLFGLNGTEDVFTIDPLTGVGGASTVVNSDIFPGALSSATSLAFAVPEPSTAILAGLGMLGALARRRRSQA